jgi:hypothetical protein
MIINVPLGAFGGPLRNGDMVAVANVVEYLRKTDNLDIKFHLLSDAISQTEYCQKFYQFLLSNTDYFSVEPGMQHLTWKNINLWDFRGLSGDLVKIQNNKIKEDKVVVFPLLNAEYNTYRNWPDYVFNDVIEKNNKLYPNSRKILCLEKTIDEIEGWEQSTDFLTNLEHIMTCKAFVGGDTGTSHFTGALENGPDRIFYMYSGHGLLHTTPFYSTLGKGKIIHYWHNLEHTNWN